MVYDWEPHKDVLYRLYIQERKHLEQEIIPYMIENYQFNPSKRAYQTQFKRWAFPSKQNPLHRDLDLVARVKELWEQNTNQRDMLNILNDEGYNVKERELMRLRAKHRWLLRVPNGTKIQDEAPDFEEQLLAAINESEMVPSGQQRKAFVTDAITTALVPAPPTEEVLRKRKERQDELQTWSDERWAAKKRRRRTRGWGGMGADPPGPPRFPSETTLGESQQYLSLDAESYRRVREHFQKICEEESIIKKTLAGPERWQAAKDRLVQEDAHLQTVFWPDSTNLETKALALDVICLDVTKRMRTSDRCMTIADAKNALGVNPEQGRQIRDAFYKILKANHFTSKTEAGKELWGQMKQQWIDAIPFLQQALRPDDPQQATKARALDVLCRDVMKRFRDDSTKKALPGAAGDESNQPDDTTIVNDGPSNIPSQPVASAPAPTAAVVTTNRYASTATSSSRANGSTAKRKTLTSVDPALPSSHRTAPLSDLQIDPTLLQPGDFLSSYSQQSTPPVAVYIRPHPTSEMYQSTKMWLGTLTSRTVGELHNLLLSKWPDAVAVRVDGVEKGVNGEEIAYLIEEDEELDAYLDHVQGRKAVFVAMLKRG